MRERLKADMLLLSELIADGAREETCEGCGITLLVRYDAVTWVCSECGYSPNPDEATDTSASQAH